jgi:hypothetical protein
MLSVDEINKLQAENEQLRKVNVLNDLLTVFAGALLGTIAGQLLIRFIYGFMDALLR